MTTELGPPSGDTAADSTAARIDALRRRRTTAAGANTATAAAAAPAATTKSHTRRRHAAAGARLVAGSLSAATTLALMGFTAGPASSDTSAVTPPDAVAPAVIIVRRGTGATAGVATPAVSITPAAGPPLTASRGS